MNTPEEKAAFIISQSVCAMIEAMGMQAENEQHKHFGHSMAYTAEAFVNLQALYGIEHNSVIRLLSQ